MKILTANIVLGLQNMDRLVTNIRGGAAYHSWGSLAAILFPPLRGRFGGPSHSPKRIEYLQKHENLNATIRLISEASPDILILNEVVLEIHKSRLDHELKEMGFATITYGLASKYPDAHVSTLVATKEEADSIIIKMPQLPYPGSGGGVAGLRLRNKVSVIGAHMAFGSMDLWTRQLVAISNLIKAEKALGNKIIFAGDCNETEQRITSYFSKLDLVSVDGHNTPTCPTFLPRIFQKSLDHIYISNTWSIKTCRTIAFGSDHLALYTEVT